MALVRLFILALLIPAYAGCISETSDEAEIPPQHAVPENPEAHFQLDTAGAMVVKLEALSEVVMNLTLANERRADADWGTPACGFAQWGTSGLGYGDGPNAVEGPGVLARFGVDGQPVLEAPGGGNGLLLVLAHGKWVFDITLAAGETAFVRLSSWHEEGEEPLYRPSASIEAKGNLKIEQVDAPRFHCSGGYVNSDKPFLQTGFGPAATVAMDGSDQVQTEDATEALLVVFRYPGLPTAPCRAAIVVDGTTVDEDQQPHEHCLAQYWGEAGTYELQYDAVGVEARVYWAVWG